jgi:hypothetical protein
MTLSAPVAYGTVSAKWRKVVQVLQSGASGAKWCKWCKWCKVVQVVPNHPTGQSVLYVTTVQSASGGAISTIQYTWIYYCISLAGDSTCYDLARGFTQLCFHTSLYLFSIIILFWHEVSLHEQDTLPYCP